MGHLHQAVADFGLSLGLPTLALDTHGGATLKIGDGQWSLHAVDDGQALLLVHTMDVPFCTAEQLASALAACHAHLQPAHPVGTLRLGARGRGASTQWVGCLRLNTPTDGHALTRGVDTVLQWLNQCAHETHVAGRH